MDIPISERKNSKFEHLVAVDRGLVVKWGQGCLILEFGQNFGSHKKISSSNGFKIFKLEKLDDSIIFHCC